MAERQLPPLRNFGPWVRQFHVVLFFVLLAKLWWFDAQLDLRISRLVIAAVSVGTVLALTAWLPLVRWRWRVAVGLAINVCLTLLIYADLIYFRYFGGLLSLFLVEQTSQLTEVQSSITALLSPWDAVFFVDFVVYAWWWRRKGSPRPAEPITPRTRELSTFACVMAVVLLIAPIASQARTGDAFKGWWDMAAYRGAGLIGFHVYDAGRYIALKNGPEPLTDSELAEVEGYWDQLPEVAPDPELPAYGAYEGADVLYVQIEALERFAVDAEVSGEPVMPELQAIIDESYWFTSSYHQTSVGRTSDAEWTTLCSRMPASAGAAYYRYVDNDHQCLPAVLKAEGYETAAHHAFHSGFWNRSFVYPKLGFDEFYSIHDYEITEEYGLGLGDRSFVEQVTQRLDGLSSPRFDFAITITSHHPYLMPNLPSDLEVGALEGSMMGDYLRAVHYTDQALGDLVADLKASGRWDSTIVVMYGDHDSGILEPELYAEALGHDVSPLEFAQVQDSVPILIHVPDGQHGVIDRPMSQLDITPTVLHLLGVDADPWHLLGHNRFAVDDSAVVFRDGSWVNATHRWQAREQGGLDSGCYDLATGDQVGDSECEADRTAAALLLRVSDRIHEHDLLAALE